MTEENGFNIFTEPFGSGYDDESFQTLLGQFGIEVKTPIRDNINDNDLNDILSALEGTLKTPIRLSLKPPTGKAKSVPSSKRTISENTNKLLSTFSEQQRPKVPAPAQTRELVVTRGTGVWNIPNYVRITDENTSIDPLTGNIAIKYGEHTLYFYNCDIPPELTGFTRALWTFILIKTTGGRDFDKEELRVDFTADEVSKWLYVKDNRHLRDKIIESLEILRKIGLPFKKHERARNIVTENISSGSGVTGNKLYMFRFTPNSYTWLMKSAAMRVSPSILGLDRQRHPGSEAVMIKLSEDLNMNIGTKREGIISVKALFEVCHAIPSEQDVRNSDRNFTKRRSKTLDSILEYLVEAGELDEYHYTHANSKPLTDEELANFTDYSLYKGLYVHYKIKDYPYEQKRAEAAERLKKQRIAAQKAKARKVKAAQSKADVDASATEQADKEETLRP